VSLQSQELIEQYVRDLGGGFLFAGGENGYGLGGWYRTTIARILPVRMETERRQEMPSVAMALVIDRSGSMTGMPMEMAKKAAKATLDVLAPDDVLEVVAFDSQPHRYVKMQPARNRSQASAGHPSSRSIRASSVRARQASLARCSRSKRASASAARIRASAKSRSLR